MRDPNLVHRAERAALALERAWDRWRTMHGLGSEPSGPVSSYVGYSLEEPWGQPRVVFGVGAEEAERLAALLDGHACVGPVYAEITGRPEWRRTPVPDPSPPARPADDHLNIPAQARPPAADMLGPATPADSRPEIDGTEIDRATIDRATIESAAPDSTVMDSSEIDATDSAAGAAAGDAMLSDAVLGDVVPSDVVPSDVAPSDPSDVAPRDAAPNDVAPNDTADEPPAGEQTEPAGEVPTLAPPLVPLPPLPDRTPAMPAKAGSLAAAPIPTDDVKPAPGPGYRGPRYQGSPPRYRAAQGPDHRAAQGPDHRPSADAAGAEAQSDVPAPASKADRAKPRQMSKLNRTRRQGPGAHEAWESAGEQPATGHAL
jgi:hypothetical protein